MHPVFYFCKRCTLKVLFFLLLQCVINVAIFNIAKDATLSRSAYFKTLENKRLMGHVVKRFESPSLMSCSHSCLRNTWCTSTNFKLFSEDNIKGTCELNKHSISPLDEESTSLNDQLGVIFSMFFKVMCFNSHPYFSSATADFLHLRILKMTKKYCLCFISLQVGVFIVVIAKKDNLISSAKLE